MSSQDNVDYARYLVEHGNTVVGISLVRELLEHIDAQDEALAAARRATLLEAADAVDPDEVVDWEEVTEPAGRRHAAEQLAAMAEEQTGPLLEHYRARILTELADRAAEVIQCGDVAEVAAPSGVSESGRGAAIDARDLLQEDPVAWIRAQAEPRTEVGS